MNKINKKEHLLVIIMEALEEIRVEIAKAKLGIDTIDGLPQLQYIESSLEQIVSMFNSDSLMEIGTLKLSIARLVIDTWPLSNGLGEKICQIEYEYNCMNK